MVLRRELEGIWIFSRSLSFFLQSFPKPRPSVTFSEVDDIFGYVPQAMVSGALFPTLLCDISKIDQELVGWDDPDDPTKDSHNAIFDLPGLVEKAEGEYLFTFVRQYQVDHKNAINAMPLATTGIVEGQLLGEQVNIMEQEPPKKEPQGETKEDIQEEIQAQIQEEIEEEAAEDKKREERREKLQEEIQEEMAEGQALPVEGKEMT